LHFGRLFNAITSGTSAGESIGRLQELGLMTSKVKIEFEALADAQKKGEKPILTQTEAMTLLQGVFSKTAGAMERLSTTTEGKLSNVKYAVDNLKVAFGTGFNDGLKSALDAANGFLPQLEGKFSTVGNLMGRALEQAAKGNLELFVQIGIVIGEAISKGLLDVLGNAMTNGIRGFLRTGSEGLSAEKRAAMENDINRLLGPERRPQERAMDIMDGMKPSLAELSRLGATQDPINGPDLPNGYHDKMLEYQFQAVEYLRKLVKDPFAAPPQLPVFSR